MRSWACLLLLASAASAAPAGQHIVLLDLTPSFAKPAKMATRVLRNRTLNRPGLFLGGKQYRGLNCHCPSRVGFDLQATFSSFRVKVGVLDGSPSKNVTFRILGDGKVLAATPPLFVGTPPVPLEVSVKNVFLLELVVDGTGHARGAWIDGVLTADPDRDLSRFRAFDAPFSPKDYPVAFRRKVNKAIDDGVSFMRFLQKANGSWEGDRRQALGVTALVTLAMLKAGVKPTDHSMVKAFEFMKTRPLDHTYSVSVLLMALEAKYFPGGADEKDAYRERPRVARKLISEEDQAWIRKAADWLAGQQGMGYRNSAQRKLFPVWRYPQGGYDLSNTQYALLGLSAANRCGTPTSRVWLPTLKFLLGAQDKEGPKVVVSRYERRKNFVYRRYENAQARGFGYQVKSLRTGSMTSAGLASLILCQQALYRKRAFQLGWKTKTREGIRDALAWVEEYFDVQENPFRGRAWWAYYLFNVERSGVLLDTRYIGTRDWYKEGADALMAVQNSAGNFGGMIDTAFAVLFLKRATVPAMTSPLD